MEIEFLELDNLTESECQALVIPSNVDLWVSSRVGQDVLLHAGDEIEVEAMAQAPIAMGEAVITSAGKLEHTSMIIHVVVYGGRKWFPEITQIELGTFNALVQANEYAIESLALPILGEPNRWTSIEDIAKTMWQGLQRFLKNYPDSPLKVLKFVIGDENTLDQFFDAFAEAQEQAKDDE